MATPYSPMPLSYIMTMGAFRAAKREAERQTTERFPVGSRWRVYGPNGAAVVVENYVADAPDWVAVKWEGGRVDAVSVENLWPEQS